MHIKRLATALIFAPLLAAPAFAQSNPAPATSATPAATMQAPAMAAHKDWWRASKLVGLNVYNQQNEKVGDINEILIDKSGNAHGAVIGVGGFLGMGEHAVLVDFNKLSWVDQPVRSTTTTGAGTTTTTRTQTSSTNDKGYPDHAVLNATKEQLKAMPEYKLSAK